MSAPARERPAAVPAQTLATPVPRVQLTVSVVICGYTEERFNDIAAAIASMQEQTREPLEVLISIDHNEALYRRAMDTFADPDGDTGCRVRVMRNSEPQGLSGARNTALRVCRGEVVAFLDDDAVAEPTWLAELLAPLEADERVMVVGGWTVPAWETSRPRWWPAEFDWVVGCAYHGMPTVPTEVRNAFGGNGAWRASVFKLVGDFTSGIGRKGTDATGGEETELQIRLHQAMSAARVIHQPSAVIHHRVPAVRSRWAYFQRRCRAEGRSKALISGLVGAGDALSSERTYVRSVLPRGVLHGLRDVLRGEFSGLGRAAAIIGGVGVTTLAYGWAKLRRRRLPGVGA